MGRIVYQPLIALTVTADATQDLWSVLAGASNRIRLLGWEVHSNAIAAALIELKLHRATSAGTGGSASSTEELADEFDSAVTASVRTLDVTTQAGNGGDLMGYQWEQLGGVGHVWTPEMAPKSKVSEGFALKWLTALGATISGYICWEEL